jgi:hypothetical protein
VGPQGPGEPEELGAHTQPPQREVPTRDRRKPMAAKKDLIISKSRTKGAVKKCNVSGEFYGALDKKVRELIVDAERRAIANKRKTLKPADL